ncbi:phosphopantetheine-binding protein [Actinomadura fibrosa]|uniref:Phosphopantetheine-binding protein n=1 Tax=Actinomadura fibrosa TaxID=111802 RepID=A0ABW2XIZ0_9ACTN|nr:phosphopantetheine-binding protein [Actinomadura fibrosa]
MGEDRAAALPSGFPGGDRADELRAFVGEWLPAHMVPSVIVEVDELPRTASGKLDRAALPAPPPRPVQDGGRAPREGAGPSGTAEQRIAAVFAEVLHRPAAGADDNFFHLGGTSVHAVAALALIAERLGTRIPALRFFQSPTPRRLATVLREESALHEGAER